MTPAQLYLYADFFARLPAVLVGVSVGSFWIEWMRAREASK